MSYLTCFATLAIGSFIFTLSYAKDMKNQLKSIKKTATTKKTQANAMKQFIEFIDMHTHMKLLSPNNKIDDKVEISY